MRIHITKVSAFGGSSETSKSNRSKELAYTNLASKMHPHCSHQTHNSAGQHQTTQGMCLAPPAPKPRAYMHHSGMLNLCEQQLTAMLPHSAETHTWCMLSMGAGRSSP